MEEVIFLTVTFIPLILTLWLANLADREWEKPRPIFAILTYLLLGLFWGLLFSGGALSALAGTLFFLFPDLSAGAPPLGDVPASSFLLKIGLALWLPALAGLLLPTPPARRLLARVIPIDPGRMVHAVALSFSMLVAVNLWLTLAIGLDTLVEELAAGPEMTTATVMSVTWVQDVLMALMALVGVGWLTRRGWRESLQRLGLAWPTWRQALLAAGLGAALVGLLLGVEHLLNLVGISFDEDVSELTEQLVGPLMTSVPGILTLGLAAALGEEMIFRGALQPRFGVLLTAILFALLHSNYGVTLSTAVVLVLGLVLGWLRLRSNTTIAMITHATYNIILGALAYYGL